MPSITSIFTATSLACGATLPARRPRARRTTPARLAKAPAVPSPLRRGEACESFIGQPLHARRPRGAPRAAGRGARRRPSRRHLRLAGDVERGHGRSAGQRHAAVLAAVPGHAGRSDGVSQVLRPGRKQRRRRPGGEAAAHQRRRPHLDADAAARRALLERGARPAARRALHVRAAVQGARAVGASRSTASSTAPTRVCRIQRPARSQTASRSAGSGSSFHLTRPDAEWLQKLALPPAALLPPSVGAEEIGTDVTRLVGTGPYHWASYAPVRQLVLKRNPYFKAWAPRRSPTATSTRSCSASA